MNEIWPTGEDSGQTEASQRQQAEVPFWGWEDLLVFAAMALPSLLAAGLLI